MFKKWILPGLLTLSIPLFITLGVLYAEQTAYALFGLLFGGGFAVTFLTIQKVIND